MKEAIFFGGGVGLERIISSGSWLYYGFCWDVSSSKVDAGITGVD